MPTSEPLRHPSRQFAQAARTPQQAARSRRSETRSPSRARSRRPRPCAQARPCTRDRVATASGQARGTRRSTTLGARPGSCSSQNEQRSTRGLHFFLGLQAHLLPIEHDFLTSSPRRAASAQSRNRRRGSSLPLRPYPASAARAPKAVRGAVGRRVQHESVAEAPAPSRVPVADHDHLSVRGAADKRGIVGNLSARPEPRRTARRTQTEKRAEVTICSSSARVRFIRYPPPRRRTPDHAFARGLSA